MICAFSNSAETVPWAREMFYFPLTVLLSTFVDSLSSEKSFCRLVWDCFPYVTCLISTKLFSFRSFIVIVAHLIVFSYIKYDEKCPESV